MPTHAKKQRRSLFMPDALWSKAQSEAKKQERSISWVIRKALERYLR